MTVREFYKILNEKISKDLSFEWDNDGLMCCPDSNREVKSVLVALDVTREVVEIAIKGGYDVILSHHPFVFKGIKSIDDKGAVSSKAIALIREGISVMSFHTRLDSMQGGVNDKLCELLNLTNIEPVFEDGIPLGRIGMLENEMSASEFARAVKKVLGAPFVLLSDAGIAVKKVAVIGGSGKDCLGAVSAQGADTFVSGRLDYHLMTDVQDLIDNPINLIEAGHFYTEAPVCEVLLDMVAEIDSDIVCDICNSNVIKAI